MIRHCGWGVPNIESAKWSASNSLTLIVEDKVHPYKKVKSEIKTRDMNLHTLPWPKEELEALGETRAVSYTHLSYPQSRLSDMVLDQSIEDSLNRIIKEQRFFGKIKQHGLSPRRKLLLVGPPGTGKTMTASALAGELGVPLFSVRLDSLITKFMGETAAKLRQIFDAISNVRGIYFFDEFDAIGSQRGQANDVGEIRRVLNSFLQMLEHDNSNSVIIAATNHPEALDYALFRRFDDMIQFGLSLIHISIPNGWLRACWAWVMC